jgi:hypothetical protein
MILYRKKFQAPCSWLKGIKAQNSFLLPLQKTYNLMQTILTKKWIAGILLLAITFSTLSCSSSRRSIAIEEGWELLGESKVNFVRDRDQVQVLSSNLFTAIRFKVENRDVHMNELHVVFQNGDKLDPAIDENITADQYSRDIQLGPEGKAVRSIDFRYRTTGNLLKGRANVLVFGKRYVPPYYPR